MLVSLGLLISICVGGTGQDSPPLQAITLDGEFPWVAPVSLQDWEHRRALVRRRVLVSAGLWPAPVELSLDPPVIHGAIARDGYRVEKVYFESLPGFRVTGNLYSPDQTGEFPGVLSPHGHWTDGRFSTISDADSIAQLERGEELYLANARYHLQARCATLARAGHVVFHYDMVGYADSGQLGHAEGFGDLEAELWGLSAFGLQTLNSIRALDFLSSLDQVDPERIAVTGGSGGGTQTFILGAIDERPQVLFPAVMVSTSMQGGCICENASHLRIDTGNVEFAALVAPRPLGLTGANDWTREILTSGGPQLRELYELHDASHRLGIWCYPEQPHNYNSIARAHLYGFLAQHLGSEFDAQEPPLIPIEPERLRVYDAQHPPPTDGPSEVRGELMQLAHDEVSRLGILAGSDPREFHRVVGGALATLVAPRSHSSPPRYPSGLDTPAGVPGTVVVRGNQQEPALLEIVSTEEAREGSLATDTPLLIEAPLGADSTLGESWRALGGRQLRLEILCRSAAEERSCLPVDDERHESHVSYTFGYNRTLLAERVSEVLAAVDQAPALLGAAPGQGICLRADADSAPWILLAAALAGDRVSHVAVEYGWDFDQVASTDDPNFLPGAMRWGGMEFYAALVAPRPLLLVGCDEVPPVIRGAYAAHGAEEAVSAGLRIGEPELLHWLATH